MVSLSGIFSFNGETPSKEKFQMRERLDKTKETFKGFLNMTSTMIGSAKTKREKELYNEQGNFSLI